MSSPPDDIDFIRSLIADNPTWHRRKLSIVLAEAWNWRNAKGDLKDMACLLFGSAAWAAADRDAHIGWNRETRQRNVNLTANNTQFLILPWVPGCLCRESHCLYQDDTGVKIQGLLEENKIANPARKGM